MNAKEKVCRVKVFGVRRGIMNNHGFVIASAADNLIIGPGRRRDA